MHRLGFRSDNAAMTETFDAARLDNGEGEAHVQITPESGGTPAPSPQQLVELLRAKLLTRQAILANVNEWTHVRLVRRLQQEINDLERMIDAVSAGPSRPTP